MQSKFVLITEVKTDKTRQGKDYAYILDQDKIRWNLFNGERVEINKGYVFRFEQNGEYQNVKEIEPVINILKQEAMKDLANRNDIIRLLQFCLSTTKDLVVAGKLEYVNITNISEELYKWINDKADSLMPKENDER